ncbi:MAG: tetratricopeptide repeat protein, partial [Gemmatimonadota bacterium]|nr:tetratricopeptide repeat protein [Gemmatimonadota bacterium]
ARALAAPTVATPTADTPTIVAPPPVSPSLARRRRVPVAATTLAVGFVLGLGVLFGWLRSHGGAEDAGGERGVKRVAVLPFENLGQADDDYFADGLTDAVRGKLAALPNLRVAARASSGQYKRTAKSPQQIGRELGVQYLLTGTVRWLKGAPGQGRVQVSPELVQVSTASTKWQEPFDASLTDVFQVQADVATRVAQALGVALGSGERERLGARPTANLAAYDLYLRGDAYYNRGYERENFRIARQMLERAVALDSGFALAHANLAVVRAAQYWFYYDRTDSALAGAKAAADEALRLQPDLPEGHLALGYYWYWGRLDYDQALRELTAAQATRPNDADLVFAIGAVRRRQGNWKEAIANMTRAVELDPRSNVDLFNLGETWWLVRDYARAANLLDDAIALAPDWALAYVLKAEVMVAQSEPLPKARTVLHTASDRFGFPTLARAVTQNLNIIEPTFLVTADSAFHPSIAALALPDFPDSLGYYRLKSELYRFARRPALERAYLDSARVALETRVRERPDEATFHAKLGLVYSHLGRAAEANREGEVAARLLPLTRDAYRGGSVLAALALIESRTGRQDAALDKLERLLSIPSVLTLPLLRMDPAWDALRTHPRFRRLVGEDR